MILTENGYVKNGDLKMGDYKKINVSHRLSSYKIALPLYKGIKKVRQLFLNWNSGGFLTWYRAYNATKHDRHNEFSQASFDNLIEAICGLAAILSAQFWQGDFIPSSSFLALEGSPDGMESAIGGYFRVEFPNNWSNADMYDFTYEDIKDLGFAIENFDYNSIRNMLLH